MTQHHRSKNDLYNNLISGDRRSIALVLNEAERNTLDTQSFYKKTRSLLGRAHVIGITGSPGAGKSTLVNALTHVFRKRSKSVGIIAIDPSSPFSYGAVLGDRIRMNDHSSDDGVFIRSLATRGHLGGLSQITSSAVDILDAAGKEIIIIETVGTGQTEVDIMDIAHTVSVICAPGLGDDVQAIKAGILEIADILVINKADLPQAAISERFLRESIAHNQELQQSPIPVIKTISTTHKGFDSLYNAIQQHHEQFSPDKKQQFVRHRMEKNISHRTIERLKQNVLNLNAKYLEEIANTVLSGDQSIEVASDRLITKLFKK